MGQPLSATQLRNLFDEPGDHYLSNLSYHVRELARAGVIKKAGSRQVRGATETFYFFPTPPSNGKAAS